MKRTITAAFSLLCASSFAQTLYNNGPLSTGATAENGTAAPTGTTWSELQHDAGNTSEVNANNGSSAQGGGSFGTNRLADDFTIGAGQTWNISSIVLYSYVTGASEAGGSPFFSFNLQIWNGRPGDAGSTVVFGNTATNRLASTGFSGIYRTPNSVVNPPGGAPLTNRPIWQNVISTPVTLSAGTYWIDYQFLTTTGTGFSPLVTIPGARTRAGANARQLTPDLNNTSAIWVDVQDTGNPATAPDVNMDIPFIIQGAPVPEPATMAILGVGVAALIRRRRK